MIASTTLLLALALGVLGAPSATSGFDDFSIRTIRLISDRVEKLPIAVIEGLRFAPALPRPLSSESYDSARTSLANITSATGTVISDEAIEELQGRYQRKLWGPGYVDITDGDVKPALESRQTPSYPTPNPSAHPELTPMLNMVTASELKSYVTSLSNFSTRYYRSTNASAPATWIQSQLSSWLGSSQVKAVSNSFAQPNIVARIEAKSGSANAPIVILGAHLDSTSQTPTTKAPGADDDASGVAVIMAMMRILKANNYQGTYAIEAHAYAGEEGGLLGSKALAASYKSAGKSIRGLLDFEMIGYQPSTSTNAGKSSTISILSDPNAAMSSHMTQVVAAHTTGDTVDKLDFNKATDFVKAGLAWVNEVAA
ncbi:hypothetical protein PQX77_016330 [Marasmius sp. AFHP31]|nr:hypothetical protein PQX77_016330 [Marasmius sp. AFHP31]